MEARKVNRLNDYDYSQNGYYFITVCTAKKLKIFGNIVGANCVRPHIELSNIGEIVDSNICKLNDIYDTVFVDKYVVMPNHIHFIIKIIGGRTQFAPTISRVIKQFKGKITKQIGFSVWQKSFYDHIIRDENDYLRIWEYIEENPAKWAEDKYYTE